MNMNVRRWEESTFYEILEVDPAASGREVHSAYVKAKESYSPESPALYTMFTPEEARELLKMVDEAFAVLSNQARRTEYDLALAKKGHPAFLGLLQKEPLRVAEAPRHTPKVSPMTSSSTAAASKANPTIRGEEGAVLKSSRPGPQSTELPEGFARSRFGVYEINNLLENELSTLEECDGSFIQKLRQYKKVNFDQLSDATRITKSYLAAIENNAFDALPAPVFVRGFLVQICRTLGIPDRIADAYMKRYRRQN